MPFSDSLKQSVRKRALGRCCICQEPFVNIHHIIPQAEGGPDSDSNAAPLCPNCHRRYGDNERHRNTIREFRDNWYDKVANAPIVVQFTLEIIDQGLRIKTFDDFEQHILELSVDNPKAAFLQVYEQMTEQVRVIGRALGMDDTDMWDIPTGLALLRAHIQDSHSVVTTMFEILDKLADLYEKTVMPDDEDEPVTDHYLLQSIAVSYKQPRYIRGCMKYISFEGKPKVWPVLEGPMEP